MSQSSKTPFSLSLKSDQSGRTSSGFVEVMAKAREASWPANAIVIGGSGSACLCFVLVDPRGEGYEVGGHILRKRLIFTTVGSTWLVRFVASHIKDFALQEG